MSDETQRMSDKEWNDLGADLVNNAGHHKPFDVLVSRLFTEARRARRREAEQDAVLARIQNAVAGWGHVEGCDRFGECDERASGEECGYHGNEEPCPQCECGKGEILGILAAPEGVPCSKCGKPGCEAVAGVAPLCDDCFPLAAPEGK